MKAQADKNRSERSFEVGDKVYLKLQPYVQNSVAYRIIQKLSFRYYGPFEVLQKIGAVAYKLNLPQDSRIHLVVHVSQLKRHIPPLVSLTADLSSICTEPSKALVLEAFLDTRPCQKGNSSIKQVLVQWTALLTEMATWEGEQDMKDRYPHAPAWGQASGLGGGSVREE